MLAPGTVVDGRFEIVEFIGEGGMGTVYAARHKNMDRTIALKLLKANLIKDEDKIARFRNEARVLSSLKHPNIIAIHAIGVADSGQPYMAMDIVSGETLSEAIARRGPFTQDDALRICIELCAGLEYAHTHKIVHRDIKPSNIILSTASGGATIPKLVDFGIAKMLDSESAQHQTRTGVAVGSVFYLSPGQLEGRAADASSDIYALGCTLYEMLTGAPAFEADNFFEVAMKHHNVLPEGVNKRNPNANISDSVQQILNQMIAKEHHARYQSASDLRADLEFALEGKPILHAPKLAKRATMPSAPRTKAGSGQPRKLIPIAIVSAVACAAAAIVFVGFHREPDKAALRSQAESAVDFAQRNMRNGWDNKAEATKLLPHYERTVAITDKYGDPLLSAKAHRLYSEMQRGWLLADGHRPSHKELSAALESLQQAVRLSHDAYEKMDNPEAKLALDLERYKDQHEYIATRYAANEIANREDWNLLLKYFRSSKHRVDHDYRYAMLRMNNDIMQTALMKGDAATVELMSDFRTGYLREIDLPPPAMHEQYLELERKLQQYKFSPQVQKHVQTAYGESK